MPADAWKRTTLSNFVSLQRGHDLPEPERRAGDVPVMGSFGLTGWHDTTKCSGPGVTVGRSGASFGVVSYVDRDYWPLNTALYVTDFHGNDERFVYYLLKTIDFTAYNTGSAQPSLNRNHLVNIAVDLPELAEQRAIVNALGSLDDKIEGNRRTGRALEGLARGVFKAWFVDFEPVKAKAAGATAFPGMPPETFATLPTRLTDSELGPVPEGWTTATLRDLATFITGGTPSKSEPNFWNGTFPWVSAKDMHGRIISDSELRLTDAGRDSVRRIAPRHATLMVIRGMSLMTEVRIGWCTREVAFNQDLRAFIAREGVPPEFIHLWLTSSEEQLMQLVDTASHGTGRILTDRLDSMTIARPHDGVMRAFQETSQPIMALRELLHSESAKLGTLRDYLLPRLLSGRVRVGEVEALAEEVR